MNAVPNTAPLLRAALLDHAQRDVAEERVPDRNRAAMVTLQLRAGAPVASLTAPADRWVDLCEAVAALDDLESGFRSPEDFVEDPDRFAGGLTAMAESAWVTATCDLEHALRAFLDVAYTVPGLAA